MQRLTTRAQFQAVLNGQTVSRTAHFVLHRKVLTPAVPDPLFPAPEHAPAVWLGAMLPKRWAKRAVTRNAMRRQIYGIGSSFEAQSPTAAHVVRLRSAFNRQQFPSATSAALKLAVRQELQQLFVQAQP